MFNDVSLQRNNLVQNILAKKLEKEKQEKAESQPQTLQNQSNKANSLTANANDILAIQNLSFVSINNKEENKNIQITSDLLATNIDEHKKIYDNHYKIAFNPQSDFDKLYSGTKNFILELYNQNSSFAQENI